MAIYLHQRDAVLDYSIDWGAAYLTDGETIAASQWVVAPTEVGGLNLVGQFIDMPGRMATAMLSGGINGRRYRITNVITTTAGRSDGRSILVLVGDR